MEPVEGSEITETVGMKQHDEEIVQLYMDDEPMDEGTHGETTFRMSGEENEMPEPRTKKHTNYRHYRIKSNQPPHNRPRRTQIARTMITTTRALRTAA